MSISANFPLPINGQWSDDETKFILDTPFVYNDPEKGCLITVPAQFDTDFNSVPQFFESWFPAMQYMAAGLVHDFLYRRPKGPYGANGATLDLTREDCDDLHRRILHLKGCRWSKRQAIWSALRSGGWAAWNKHREADLDGAGGKAAPEVKEIKSNDNPRVLSGNEEKGEV